MKKYFNRGFNKYTYELFAGDYYATKERNIVLTTLLGSCISVCMRCKTTGIVGMNHFMLPSTVRIEDIVFSEDARYGINAMERMINDIMKLGGKRDSLEAKMFGGGRVMDGAMNNVAQSNIEFAQSYLQMEEIPLLSKDVGGKTGRKIFFFPDQFSVYLKRVHYNQKLENAVSREKRFLHWMREQQRKEAELTLFDEERGKNYASQNHKGANYR